MTNHAEELSGATNEHEAPEAAAATRELGEELRQLIATNRAAAIARKMKLAEAAAAAKEKAEALEASRIRCQQCNSNPIAEATAAREAAEQAMERSRVCRCRGCKENVLGVDCTSIAPTALAQPIMTSISELWNTPWGAPPVEPMPVLTRDVISEVARVAIEAANERRTSQEVWNFIPAKKFGTPPKDFVFKLGSQGLGFYRE